MSVAFYFDHHVPSAICEGLRRRGIDVVTAAEDGRADWPDEAILARATDLDRLVFTQDADFLIIASQSATAGRMHAGVVRDLELIAQIMTPPEMANRVEFLPLR